MSYMFIFLISYYTESINMGLKDEAWKSLHYKYLYVFFSEVRNSDPASETVSIISVLESKHKANSHRPKRTQFLYTESGSPKI